MKYSLFVFVTLVAIAFVYLISNKMTDFKYRKKCESMYVTQEDMEECLWLLENQPALR